MKTILTNALIVTAEGIQHGSIVIDPPFIESVGGDFAASDGAKVIDLKGAYVMAGIIDTHVHFREPGLTHKATIASESRAVAAGGVTSILEMPNTQPPTTSTATLQEKRDIAARDSVVNYAFFVAATHDNIDTLRRTDYTQVPGIKVFMGSSTGGMLLDRAEALHQVFNLAQHIPLVTHCEDTATINAAAQQYGDSHDFALHALIRSREACVRSTRLALELALEHHSRLHIAHVTTSDELAMIRQAATERASRARITAEACLPHLVFTDNDYAQLGARIKCNPAIKTVDDRTALRQALTDGGIYTIATDHAPHTLSEKMTGGCLTAPSGMPMAQFALTAMLEMVDEGILSLPRLTQLMSANPAKLFAIDRRGEIREGYYADLAIVRPTDHYTISDDDVRSLCRWTPLVGRTMHHRVVATYVNGCQVYDGTQIATNTAAMALRFNNR